MKAVILAIDQGTTGSTALLVDRHARVVAKGYAELPQHYPQPGWVEHRPNEILKATRQAIAQAIRFSGQTAASIQAIGITNQRETTLLWDRRSGRALANAIVWQCRRTSPMCERLRAAGHTPEIRRKTGLVLDAYFSGTKLRWLLDHLPGARRRAKQGKLAFGTVDSWLLWNLTRGAAHATDATNASRTLLYNIRTKRWDGDLLRLFGIPAAVLPDVRASDAFFGRTAGGALGLPKGIPIAGMAGDQQASMVGHGCLRPGTAKNTYGTGCFLLLHTGRRALASRAGLLTTLVAGTNGPAYALEGSVFIAGAAIQWMRDGLGLIAKASETEAIARSVPDTGGVYVVPAFVGLGAPYWDMQARGAIVGITRGTTRAMIVRATLESLAYQTRDVVDAMQRDSGLDLKELRVDGGAARNDWLMQYQADILGIPILRPAIVENTGRGAALLAGRALGWWSWADMEAQTKRPTEPGTLRSRVARKCRAAMADRPPRVFQPRMKAAHRRHLYAGWQAAVQQVLTRKPRLG
jgi:glycerol kinase